MSISVQMPNTSSLYEINETRAGRLLSGDKQYATHMGLFDKFKDFFRTEKKADAIEQLYNFIHNDNALTDGNKNEVSLSKTMKVFDTLKSLATDQHKDVFRTEINPYEGLDFRIGSNVVKTLDNCMEKYDLYQLNHHPKMKNLITERINHLLNTQKEPIPVHQLEMDMMRQTGGSLDGKILSNSTEENQQETIKLTRTFCENLPPKQHNALTEVGSQAGFAHTYAILMSESNLFWENFASVDVSPSTVIYKNEGSSDITVIQTLRREPSQMYYDATTLGGLNDRFPTMQMDVAFTISKEGQVDCALLQVNDHTKPHAYSLEDVIASAKE